ncbi:uncharacterized protein LOC113236511 [Hyposmocoma kahamanoa]|uniref:uncharacterized protein LOC113236511 n=1 Tax=Hyposmocoma kahamanoa TaxID=1477025 RepID=UPI000E6D8B78|nr:uncharacterized protein LOC113236511 [Hyposmocoma kahamanoa]
MSFKSKVVLVTGGSSGIGAAAAIKFAEEGAKVSMVGRNEKKLQNVSDKCKKAGSIPLVINADVTKDEDVKRIISDTIKHYGRLDILVNNAGTCIPSSILAPNAVQTFDSLMALNLRSAIYLTNLAAPYIVESKGNIINISSVAALRPFEDEVGFAYCTSKAGLDHFTRCVALELAPKGVRVNSINPGPVRTDIAKRYFTDESKEQEMWESAKKMTPLNRISEPEEIGDLILYLASEKARSITGAVYAIDNGYLMK